MSGARTPGPWRVVRESFCDGDRDYTVFRIRPESWVAGDIAIATEGNGPAASNAAFIVEACNAHDTLRAERDSLRSALLDIVEIASHRWRALPKDSPEKLRLSKACQALAIGDSEPQG